MAVWQCTQCGYEKEARCKPRKCPECSAKDSFTKKDASNS
ncbi:RCKP-type rubredoxin-like domain-containing protein [Neomoorella thermoacetica]